MDVNIFTGINIFNYIFGRIGYNNHKLNIQLSGRLYAFHIALFSYALANMFVQPFSRMNEFVGKGKLDIYLVRPIHSLIYIMLQDIEFGYLAHITVAVVAMVGVIGLSGVIWTAQKVTALIVTLIGAFFLQCTFGILPGCITFFTIQSDRFAGLIRWSGREFIKYPIKIYPMAVRFIVSFVIPVGFINYYPALSLLNKTNNLWVGPLLSLGLGSMLFLLTIVMWNVSLKHYTSSC